MYKYTYSCMYYSYNYMYQYKNNGMNLNIIIQACVNTHIIVSILLYKYPYNSTFPCNKCNYVLSDKSSLRLVVNGKSSKSLSAF